jgi:hypothetical protein
MRRLLLALSLVGCRGESTTYITEDVPSCVRSICEVTMSTVLTGTPANANFGTGLTRPDSGEDPSIWSSILEQQLQQIEDREQWLKLWLPTSRLLTVPIAYSLINTSTRFDLTTSGGAHYWLQSSVASAGLLMFEVPWMPPGVVIKGAHAWIGNGSATNLTGLTKPTLELNKSVLTVGGDPIVSNTEVSIGTASDATTVLATYQLLHKVEITGLSETVTDNTIYRVRFTGETAGSATPNLAMSGIFVTVERP